MISHDQLKDKILSKVEFVNFALVACLEPKAKLQRKHYVVICIEVLLNLVAFNGWGLCTNCGITYIYNGAFWKPIEKDELKSLLGEAAYRMGVNRIDSNHHDYRDDLYKQFLSSGNLVRVEVDSDTTLINLRNGTVEINTTSQKLRSPASIDFMKHQLPFYFDERAKAFKFEAYLNKVLPDLQAQQVLAEYLGYIFIKHKTLKLEKALMLVGSGANGKSVFFEICSALLGHANISNFSLHKITTHDYSRAMLNGKLLNYATEINGNLDTAVFKQLVSGEPVEARLPFGNPFTLNEYAKLIFNCNELPKEVEHTDAYFRRLIIIPFNAKIPIEEQDPLLAKTIVDEELSGVFNWVLSGLKRLVKQGHFTFSQLIADTIQQYRNEANNAQMFLEESSFKKSVDQSLNLRDLYFSYGGFCKDYGYKPLSKINFKKRLIYMDIKVEDSIQGDIVFLARNLPVPHLPQVRPEIIVPDDSVDEILNEIVKKNQEIPKPLF